MNTFKVARLELNYLFFSPVAWSILTIFCIRAALQMGFVLDVALSQQVQAGGIGFSLTEYVFGLGVSVFGHINNNLYFYIPLLTMGAISRELQSGSLKLLLSSPVTVIDIVLGKYLAILSFVMLFVVFTIVLIAFGGGAIQHADYVALIPGLLGTFLLASAYAAIGLFMSSLTSYQVVAVISTIGVLAFLNLAGAFAQRVPIIADVAFWLSMQGRTFDFSLGLINSADVVYFLLIIAVFLALTILRLGGARAVSSITDRIKRYGAVFLSAGVTGFILSQPALAFHADLTRTGSQSPSPATKKVMAGFEGEWRVTYFVNVLGAHGARALPEHERFLTQRFEHYLRSNPDIEMDFVFYHAPPTNNDYWYRTLNSGKSDEELVRLYAEQNRLDLKRIQPANAVATQIDLQGERFKLLKTIEWNDRTEVLRTFNDMLFVPSEREMTAAFSRLINGPATIGYVNGFSDRSVIGLEPSDFGRALTDVSYRDALISNGFDIEIVPSLIDIPEDIEILLLVDFERELSPSDLSGFQSYLERGGNVLLATEPDNTAMQPLLRLLDVEPVISLDADKSETTARAVYGNDANEIGFELNSFVSNQPIIMPGATKLQVGNAIDFDTISLLEQSPGASATSSLAYALSRRVGEVEQRIIVLGDADFMSNGALESTTIANQNSTFVHQAFRWLSNERYPILVERPAATDLKLRVNQRQLGWIKGVTSYAIPLLLAGLAFTLLYRRRIR